MAKKRRGGLGRGFSSLLSEEALGGSQEKDSLIRMVSVGQIEANPYQPRKEFKAEELEELAASIKEHGIIQPLTVRQMAQNQYQLISGERRLRASKLSGLAEVPAYVRTANDEQMLEMALIENIQRSDLNPIEVAMSYNRMQSELKLTQEEIAQKVGKKRPTVTNFLRLLSLPDNIQAELKADHISMGHAKALRGLESADLQILFCKRIVEEELSVRQAEALISEWKKKQKEKKADPSEDKEEKLRRIFLNDLSKKLEEKLGSPVNLKQKRDGKGDIKIQFNSTGDLNRILEILKLDE